ncbi:hypothetical protein HZB69_03590 [Candidatus Amesbacteria bacterium]|nr:hypothetical protein [Candidatus Amesbacteria bacterium]
MGNSGEKSFRISKSDLKARPIFHTAKELNPVKQVIVEDKLTKEQISKCIQPNDEAKLLLKLAKINWVT